MAEMGKVKKNKIVGETKKERTMQLISPVRHNSDSQAASQEKSYGIHWGRTQKWLDSSVRMILPLHARIDIEKSKKKFPGEVAEE